METQLETILTWAYERGRMSGEHDRFSGVTNEAPLSGEWAGESIEELLGDLIDKAVEGQWTLDKAWREEEILEAYEQGYEAGNREGD